MYIATSLGIKNQPHGKKHTMSRGQDLRTNQPTQGTYKAKHFHVFYYSSMYPCLRRVYLLLYYMYVVFLKILY